MVNSYVKINKILRKIKHIFQCFQPGQSTGQARTCVSLKYSRREAALWAHDRASADGEQHQDARERSTMGRGARWGDEHAWERSTPGRGVRWGGAAGRGCMHSEIMSLGFSKCLHVTLELAVTQPRRCPRCMWLRSKGTGIRLLEQKTSLSSGGRHTIHRTQAKCFPGSFNF